MDPTTPILPTVIVTHPTPLPAVPRRSTSYTDGSPPSSRSSSYISSFFPSDSPASTSSMRRSEKHDHALLSPYPYTPRRRKSKRNQTIVQIGLLVLATLLLWTSTRWTDEWAGKGMMGLLMPNSALNAALPDLLGGGILDAWKGEGEGAGMTVEADVMPQETTTDVMEEPQRTAQGKLGAMKVEDFRAYIANQQSMTGYAGPSATMEAWDFH